MRKKKKLGYCKSVNFTSSIVNVNMTANSCKSVTFVATVFFIMCWYKSQSFVFVQDEIQAVLLF